MKNFLRACKYAWPYRYRVLFSVVCAVLAAVLWGLNFTAIYPLLKILRGDNLHTWVDKEIGRVQDKSILPLEQQIEDINSRLKDIEQQGEGPQRDTQRRRARGELADVESKLADARDELYRFEVAKRLINMLLPTGRFETLAVIMGI